MIRKGAVLPVLLACLSIALAGEEPAAQTPAAAQPAPAAAAATSAPAQAKKRELGAWWEKNAMKLKPLPTEWLFHAEGTFSYANTSGNTAGSQIDSTGIVELRKNRFTNHVFGQWSRKDISATGQGSVRYVERTFREQVDFDPRDYITFFAAIEDYRNTLMYIDKRLLVYGGVGGRIFHNDKTEFVMNFGMGVADFTFAREQLLKINPATIEGIDTSPTSAGGIVTQSWKWHVSPRFNFSEDVSYMKYVQSYLGDRWTVNVNGNFPISKHFSFNVSYRLKDENNALVKALGVLPRDRSYLMGLRFSI
jgi:putative salt-induced outer membrane protein YdiY